MLNLFLFFCLLNFFQSLFWRHNQSTPVRDNEDKSQRRCAATTRSLCPLNHYGQRAVWQFTPTRFLYHQISHCLSSSIAGRTLTSFSSREAPRPPGWPRQTHSSAPAGEEGADWKRKEQLQWDVSTNWQHNRNVRSLQHCAKWFQTVHTCVRAEHSTYLTALSMEASFSPLSGCRGRCLFFASFSMVLLSSRRSTCVPTIRKGVRGQWCEISGTHCGERSSCHSDGITLMFATVHWMWVLMQHVAHTTNILHQKMHQIVQPSWVAAFAFYFGLSWTTGNKKAAKT